MFVCVSENAAALEELLLEYESKQMAMSKGSSIKYETHWLTHTPSDSLDPQHIQQFCSVMLLKVKLKTGERKVWERARQ